MEAYRAIDRHGKLPSRKTLHRAHRAGEIELLQQLQTDIQNSATKQMQHTNERNRQQLPTNHELKQPTPQKCKNAYVAMMM